MPVRRLIQSRLAWALLSNALRVGGYMLVLPIALRTIPEAEMEIWWLFGAVQALVVQADFGLGPSISRGLSYLLAGATSLQPGAAKAGAEADPVKVAGFIHATHRVYRWVIGAAVGILILASFFIVPKIGAGTFSGGDFKDVAAFVAGIRAENDPVSAWLKRALPPEVLGGIYGDRKTNPEWDRQVRAFVKSLNALVVREPVFEPTRFAGATLRPETRAWVESRPTGAPLVRANRLLLEDAFPTAITKNPAALHGRAWWIMIASWVVFGLGVLLTLSSTRFINFLTGADHVRLAQQLALIGMAVNLALTAAGLLAGFGFAAMAVGLMGNGIVQSIGGRWGVRRHLGRFLGGGDVETGKRIFLEVWPSAWRAGVVSLGAYLIYNSNVFWASAYLGQPDASQYPFTLKLMQVLMIVCGLPVSTQVPKLARWMAAGEPRQAWSYFLRRHFLGLGALMIGVLGLWLLGDRFLARMGSHSTLLPGPLLLFMGLIYVLEFNHGYCATLVMTRNEVPFVWAATVSGVVICVGGGVLVQTFGLWGLLGTVFVVQAAWNNWWVPWLAWRAVRGESRA